MVLAPAPDLLFALIVHSDPLYSGSWNFNKSASPTSFTAAIV
ncbi:hypothetical protein ACWEYK_13065 [Staphylococcus xylosus]|nr:hypothetical protein [Staphylococcus saprophyticus]